MIYIHITFTLLLYYTIILYIKFKEIQGALDQGHSILRTVLDSCEKTLPNTSQKGVHVIRNEADTAKAEYENILTQVSQVRNIFISITF